MPRKTRNTLILAKIETTSGTDAVPTGLANAILVSDPTFKNEITFVERNNIKGFFGSDGKTPGTRYVSIGFMVEISGSGAAGTAPAWGALLRGCAMAETLTASQRAEYSPVSTGLETLTIYYYRDGVLRKALGCQGTASMSMNEGEIPKFNFTFTGIDGGEAVAANPAGTFTDWTAPLAITNANTASVNFGGTYAAGAITGGSSICSKGLTLDLANEVAFVPMLGNCQGVDVRDRKMKGSVQLQLTEAEEIAAMVAVKAGALTTMSMLHGVAAGAQVLFFAPGAQRIDPADADNEGRAHMSFNLDLRPVAGNDELLIVAL